jgi:hypothetical protein
MKKNVNIMYCIFMIVLSLISILLNEITLGIYVLLMGILAFQCLNNLELIDLNKKDK